MSMQMDACLKMEQIGTLFVLVGAPEGGGWAGGATPKTMRAFQNKLLLASKINIYIPHGEMLLLTAL